MAKDFLTIDTPKGQLIKAGDGTMQIVWNPNFGSSMTQKLTKAQEYIDSECLRLCGQFVPRDTGILEQSGIMFTEIGSGEVKYNTPYARRWYYMPANFQDAPQRGNYWFEKMKAQYKDNILNGAKRFFV